MVRFLKHFDFNTFCLWFPDVATEKTQKSLFDGIEKFDATRLKHTETQEKNPLPDKDGMFFYLIIQHKHPNLRMYMCNTFVKNILLPH